MEDYVTVPQLMNDALLDNASNHSELRTLLDLLKG